MQARTFAGSDMRQALALVKLAFGPDAMILSARVRSFGPFLPKRHEVVAVAPETVAISSSSTAITAEPATVPADHHADLSSQLQPLQQEIQRLRRRLRQRQTHKQAGPKSKKSTTWQLLNDNDVEPNLAKALIDEVSRLALPPQGPLAWRAALVHQVMQRLTVAQDLFADQGQGLLAFCGPTGVGKTTTLAKVAAHAIYTHHKRVHIISLDTFRIGAVEQLRQYNALLGTVLHVAHNVATFKTALALAAQADWVLIDTAGRSPGDHHHQNWLQLLFRNHSIEPVLVLPAAMRRPELQQALKIFTPLRPKQLIFTKLDEAATFGLLLNASCQCHLPISFVTCGQRVPEDLAIPEKKALAKLVVYGGIHS